MWNPNLTISENIENLSITAESMAETMDLAYTGDLDLDETEAAELMGDFWRLVQAAREIDHPQANLVWYSYQTAEGLYHRIAHMHGWA